MFKAAAAISSVKPSKGTQTAICVKTLKSQDTQTDWPADVNPGFDVKAAECQCSRADLPFTDVDVRDADFHISTEFSLQTSNIRSSTPVPTSTATHMEQDEAMPPISRPVQALHDKTTDESYHPSFDESLEDSEGPALSLMDCRKFVVFEESLMQLFKEGKVWEAEQRVMFANFNEAIHLAGDGRCDSPGFSAKYMTYSFVEAKSSKVIHFVQVQLGENKDVQTSNAMEKYSLIKGLELLKAKDIEIVSLTTDRHPGIIKHMRTNEQGIDHKFDTWDVAKSKYSKVIVNFSF
ncbi:hypothetical protein HPB50_011274 [Hyalomma asiaticum]|uniref:Uncharacterized protein n=1 Tax=Hyalomma asiaticum TaxID=266040 RepID=A0ACB7TIH8_HYAAI|nr:hypothetical protein HPB50_011274 [Hyalomma asiaticum]